MIVVSHDATLNPDITRGPEKTWVDRRDLAIHALTWQALQAYDVGRIRPLSLYARRFPEQEPLDGTRIPRLADVFALALDPASHTFYSGGMDGKLCVYSLHDQVCSVPLT